MSFSNLISSIKRYFKNIFTLSYQTVSENHSKIWQKNWSDFLQKKVDFYRNLSKQNKINFEQRCLLFLETTRVEGSIDIEITDNDRLLVAASAVIPVWGFKGWHYFNIESVILLPSRFNEEYEYGLPDSRMSGMVGTGKMSGKMVLSKPDLYRGFENSRDKQNVGIHEFVHLIDMADGLADGFPDRVTKYEYSAPWFEFVQKKIEEVDSGKSNIDDYAATNNAEFFAVSSEYFFERPIMLKRKHPILYEYLSTFYKQNLAEINQDLAPKKYEPCSCGSGKKYHRCCMPKV